MVCFVLTQAINQTLGALRSLGDELATQLRFSCNGRDRILRM